MHETMVAKALLNALIKEAKEQNAKPLAAKISCGSLHSINADALKFAFELAAEDTLCENTNIEITQIPLIADCKSCRKNFELDLYSPKCPHCAARDFTVGKDAPLVLEEIEFEDIDET